MNTGQAGQFAIVRPGTKSTVAVVDEMPQCILHSDGRLAEYDAKLCSQFGGQWGYVCGTCFHKYALYRTLGIGKGQKLVLRSSLQLRKR